MENLKLHDFTEYKFLSGIQYSPDGKHLAYVVHQASIEKNQCWLDSPLLRNASEAIQ